MSSLNGKDLYAEGYRLCHEGKWPMLITPNDELLKSIEKVRIGTERYYAFELVVAIERDMEEQAERKLPSRQRRQPGDRLDLKGQTFESMPVRNLIK